MIRKTHFILYRRHFADFDAARDVPVLASAWKEHLKIECDYRNSILTEEERSEEVSFWVSEDREIAIV